MATLSDDNRKEIWAEYMRDSGVFNNLLKEDLRAAINALDAFFHNNITAINNSLPFPARAKLTAEQKAKLLVFVIEKRFKTGT